VKLSIFVVILAAGVWLPGHLHYGWLLVQTVASAPSFWIRIMFSIQFILWLLPMVGLFALLVMEKFRTQRAQRDEDG
jgi:hypothetical protein